MWNLAEINSTKFNICIHIDLKTQELFSLFIKMNNSSNIAAEEICHMLSAFTVIPLLFFVAALGLAGNIFSFIVIQIKSKESIINFILKTIFIVDSVFNLSILLCYVIVIVIAFLMADAVGSSEDKENTTKIMAYPTFTVLFVQEMTSRLSCWLVVLAAFARYIAICKPFVAHKFNFKRIKICICVMTVFAFLHTITTFVCTLACGNITDWVRLSLSFFLPSILLVYFTVNIWYEVRKRPVVPFTDTERENQQINKLIFMIMMVFTVTYGARFGLMVTLKFTDDEANCLFTFRMLLFLLLLINSSSNFFVNYVCRRSFRNNAKELCKCCLCH